MDKIACETMIVLAGEQPAPNLLPARFFKPRCVFVLHTSLPKSKQMAENLAVCLEGVDTHLELVADYDVARVRERVLELLAGKPATLVNITGGTKPMSFGALEAARIAGAQAFYVRSQGKTTEFDLYAFDGVGASYIAKTEPLSGTISIADHLNSYFGKTWEFAGFSTGGPGEAFERALYDALAPGVDEVQAGWKHASKAVEVDFVIRCNNQIGIIEAKTGKKVFSAEGIKQLAVAGGQRFFGTYIKRFLVIDRSWQENESNLRELCDARGIMLVELPGYSQTGKLDEPEIKTLWTAIHAALGKPLKLAKVDTP